MEIRVLKYFLAVAREGNITKAADVLHITQPTLSRQLMQLEEELGTPLLIRGKRKIVLTESGMLLKRRAEEIISLSKKTELEISHQSDEVKGEITLACGLTEATNTMARYIKAFNTLYPDVTFKIKSGNADYIIEEIQNGLVDIGFVLEPVNLDKLDFLKLNEIETWGLLMIKNNTLQLMI
jgi:DNA-binding transcriptional LysR family regulator